MNGCSQKRFQCAVFHRLHTLGRISIYVHLENVKSAANMNLPYWTDNTKYLSSRCRFVVTTTRLGWSISTKILQRPNIAVETRIHHDRKEESDKLLLRGKRVRARRPYVPPMVHD